MNICSKTLMYRIKSFISLVLFVAAALAFDISGAHAFRGKCFLSVEGKVYIDGPCDIEMEKGGSFSFDDGRLRTKCAIYDLGPDSCSGVNTMVVKKGTFGGIFTENGRRGQMYWNGGESRQAHGLIDDLSRKGACWSDRGQTVRLCAWR